MLARSQRVRINALLPLMSSVSKRTRVDYVQIANELDSGKSLEQQNAEAEAAADAQSSAQFSWDWVQWYERNRPERMPIINSLKNGYHKYEGYVGDRGAKSVAKNIDFESFRKQIADPKFVDNIEMNLHFERATLSSIESMSTLEKWKQDSVDAFEKQCEETGDLLWPPMTQADKDEWMGTVKDAEEADLFMSVFMDELQKDFEQYDAERMMFGQESFQMKLSEHPQYAENYEDYIASRQHNMDLLMMPYHNDYVRKERLRQIQDENRRKLFLERFEHASKVCNGEFM